MIGQAVIFLPSDQDQPAISSGDIRRRYLSSETIVAERSGRKLDAAEQFDRSRRSSRLYRALIRHRGRVLLFALAATMAMAAYVMMRPYVYVAYTEILIGEPAIQATNSDVRSLERLANTLQDDLGSAAKLIGSALVIGEVIDEVDLEFDRRSSFDRIRDLWHRFADRAPDPDDDRRTSSRRLEDFRSNLKIDADPSTSVITISYRSKDPKIAAMVADGLAQTFLEHRAEKWQQSIQQAARHAQRLAETIPELNEGAQSPSALNPTARATASMEERYARLSEELTNATLELADARARLAEVEAAGTSDVVLDMAAETDVSPERGELLAQARALRRQIGTLSERSDGGNADLIRAEADYAVLQETLKEESARVVEKFRLQAHAAETRFDELQQKLHDVESELLNVRNNHIGSSGLARQDTVPEHGYEAIIERRNLVSELAASSFDTTRIIEPAAIPNRPSMVSGALLIGMTFFGAGGLGLVCAVLAEFQRKGFSDASEVEGYLGLPVLGMLPNVHGVVPLCAGMRLSSREERWALESYTFIEGVRAVFNTLLPPRGEVASPPHRVVAITSCLPDEGKTILALSLARQSAFGGAKVLLIEGDMRKFGLATKLSTVSPKKGLVDLLSGEVDQVDEIIVEEKESGADLLLASGPSEDAFAHSRSPLLKKTFSDLRQRYDLIIVDCPPVLGVSETLTLCDEADEVLFVIRWQETHRAATRSAIRELAPRSIAGVVLTQVDLADHLKYATASKYRYHEEFKSYAVADRQTRS